MTKDQKDTLKGVSLILFVLTPLFVLYVPAIVLALPYLAVNYLWEKVMKLIDATI